MQLPVFSQLVRRIGIDFGSSRVRIWTDRAGLAVDEPAVLAVDSKSRRVLAFGSEAKEMEGRVNPAITIHYPVRNGVIYYLESAQALLKLLLQRVMKSTNLISPSIMASVPAGASEAALNVTSQLMYTLGAREVYTISQPLAAGIGAGVPVADASGSFVLQMGAGLVEGAVISLGSMIETASTEAAGEYLVSRVQYRLKRDLALTVSSGKVEELVKKTLSATAANDRSQLLAAKMPWQAAPKKSPSRCSICIRKQPCCSNAMSDCCASCCQLSRQNLQSTSLIKACCSGGWRSDGLSQYLVETMGIPVSVVDKPEQAVIEGIGTAMEHLELFKQSLGYQQG